MIGPERQLKGLPAPFGLLVEPRSLRVVRLVHELRETLAGVRATHDANLMWNSIQIIRELSSMGYAAVVLNRGKVTGAHDPRFDATAQVHVEEPGPDVDAEEREAQWRKYKRIKRMLEALPDEDRERLLADLRRVKHGR